MKKLLLTLPIVAVLPIMTTVSCSKNIGAQDGQQNQQVEPDKPIENPYNPNNTSLTLDELKIKIKDDFTTYWNGLKDTWLKEQDVLLKQTIKDLNINVNQLLKIKEVKNNLILNFDAELTQHLNNINLNITKLIDKTNTPLVGSFVWGNNVEYNVYQINVLYKQIGEQGRIPISQPVEKPQPQQETRKEKVFVYQLPEVNFLKTYNFGKIKQ